MERTEQSFEVPTTRRMPRKPAMLGNGLRATRRFIVPLLVLIVVAAGSYEYGRYSVYNQYPQLSKQDEANAILGKLSLLIQLPQNETPNMATIIDAAAAKKQQAFVQDAENGDVLIIYSNADMAILYRPSTNKIIAVGPIINQPPSSAASGFTDTSPVKGVASTTNASSTSSKNTK
jgi:hypothetical protein